MWKPLVKRKPGPLVELVLGGREERLAEAERHRAADDRQAAGRASPPTRPAPGRPAGRCVRRCAGRRVCGGRPVSASIAGPTAVGLEATVAPANARPAVGLDDDVADVAGVADPPCSRRPPLTTPPPTPVPITTADEVADADGRAAPRFGQGQRPGVGVDDDRQLRSAPPTRSPAGICARRDVQRRDGRWPTGRSDLRIRRRIRPGRPGPRRRLAGPAATTSATRRGAAWRGGRERGSVRHRRRHPRELGAADIDGEVATSHARRP